jgi:hypothetical protein
VNTEDARAATRGASLARRRGLVVLAALVVAIAAVTLIFRHATPPSPVGIHLASWNRDLHAVLASTPAKGCVDGADVGVARVPGIGALATVCVSGSLGLSNDQVTFEPRAGRYDLDWTISVPYPLDQCVRALGADWWLIPRAPPVGSACPAGFTRHASP